RGSARHLDRSSQLVGQNRGERRLAEPWRAVEKDMRQGFFQLLACPEDDAQSLDNALLADDLVQASRPQRRIALPIVVAVGAVALHDGLPCHEDSPETGTLETCPTVGGYPLF